MRATTLVPWLPPSFIPNLSYQVRTSISTFPLTLTLTLVPPDSPLPANVADDSTIDHIRTEYHPGSGKAAATCPYEEYDSSKSHKSSARRTCVADPWWPYFNTREDFLFSEVLREGGLSNEQTDNLLKIIKQCLSGKGSLTFTTHSDVRAARERASLRLTPVSSRAKLMRRAKLRLHVV